MSSNQNNKKEQSVMDRIKNLKIKKTSVITSVVVLAALAVIISVTVASNRTKDKTPPPAETDAPLTETQKPDESQPDESESEKESETSKPSKPTVKPVENKIPSMMLPVNGALSTSHNPELQVYSPTLKDWRVHLGIDIVTNDGASVYSAADGTVAKVWKDDMMGYSIAVKHAGDCYTFYQNLSDNIPESIKVGASVRSGQLIGTVGDSAMVEVAAEPHLHFEMTVADLSVDPLKYFSEDAIKSLTKDSSYE
jgi:murein DD-endopeptidase MepM/ murein hydrolase activator NlpD